MCIVRWEKEKSSEAELKKKEIKKIHQKATKSKNRGRTHPLGWLRSSTSLLNSPLHSGFLSNTHTAAHTRVSSHCRHPESLHESVYGRLVGHFMKCIGLSTHIELKWWIGTNPQKNNNLITTVLNQRFCFRISIGAKNWLRNLCLRRPPLDLSLTPTGTWQLWTQVAKR